MNTQSPMQAAPQPQMLPNGDVMVPDFHGAHLARLSPGDPNHAEWVSYLQHPPARHDKRMVIGSYAAAVLVPLVGFIMGIVLAAKGSGHGAGAMIVSIFFALVWVGLA